MNTRPTMRTGTATLALAAIAAWGACGSGCSSSRAREAAMGHMGQLAPAPTTLASLGAGDALGQIVHVNDTVLAMGGNPREFWAMHEALGVNGLDPMTTLAAMELGTVPGLGDAATSTFVTVTEPGVEPEGLR